MQSNKELSFKDIQNLLEPPLQVKPSPFIAPFSSLKNLERDRENIIATLKMDLGFGDDLTSEQQDIISICLFLMDKTKVFQQLKKLNQRLCDIARTLDMYDETTNGLLGYQEGQPFKHKKLLSGYLVAWAWRYGFAPIIKLERLQSYEEFLNYIKGRFIIKDAIFGSSEDFHGEWTHAIAWETIVGAVEDKVLFLQSTPARLYSWIGQQDVRVWFHMFELSQLQVEGDLRNVNEFLKTLLDDVAAQELKVLHQLIKGRIKKRQLTGSKQDDENEQIIKNYYQADKSIFKIINDYKNYKPDLMNLQFKIKNEIIAKEYSYNYS